MGLEGSVPRAGWRQGQGQTDCARAGSISQGREGARTWLRGPSRADIRARGLRLQVREAGAGTQGSVLHSGLELEAPAKEKGQRPRRLRPQQVNDCTVTPARHGCDLRGRWSHQPQKLQVPWGGTGRSERAT